MFNPTRDQVRQFFCDCWQKHLAKSPLVGAEVRAVDLILLHPEYQPLLADREQAMGREWTPEGGETNPFLHLSLHLAIHEQVSIDQPPGIRAAFDRLRLHRDPHEAEHLLLECLGETIWEAQRQQRPMDAQAYLERVQRAAMR
ncbi:MAG: hypothetical protein RIR00_2424 [Pseudomonadota bacterium]|jgi:hypothetical protein